ncbi:protein of unknown function [Micromonospora echinofusca]|uniref:DUF4304 domain-containing protein n=1 Tax=Micromonospora echinofusca TaxID=47858 RepID=A0A1C5G7B6_MICEH|nr:DUF4304 domain-containing protein [Micromonospora echinofusca]SCG15597.1 protein of unknown function [Micromonospora echinofusca]
MSLQALFNNFVKGVAEQLAEYGFDQGKGRVFRRYSPTGDALVIEIQMSDHASKAEKVFYINVGLVLAPAWEHARQRYRLPASEQPRPLHAIWEHRIGFTTFSGGDQWRIADEAGAAEVSARVRRRLDEAVAELLPLLDREKFLAVADRREFLGAGGWRVRAWLLAEQGPSPELEHLLFTERPAHTHKSPMIQGIWNYANSRSRAADSG